MRLATTSLETCYIILCKLILRLAGVCGFPQEALSLNNFVWFWAASHRKNFAGSTKVDTGPQNFFGPQALSGPMLLNHFLLNGCRSSFKSEGLTIFAYS